MNKATNMKHLLAVLVGTALLHTPISLAAEPGSTTNGFAAIKHERFTEPPAVRDGRLTFATESRMLTTKAFDWCDYHLGDFLTQDPHPPRDMLKFEVIQR